MKRLHSVALFCTLLFVSLPTLAEQKYEQHRINLTIHVPSFGQAADDLREVVSQFEATVQNLNLSRESSNGSATIRIPKAQMAALVRELSSIGEVENQSQNNNDYTSSVLQYQERLKTYQALQTLALQKNFDQLPADTRAFATSEYTVWVKGQIDSAKSSLQSYEDQAKYAEVQVSFTLPASAEPTAAANQQPDPTLEIVGEPVSKPAKRGPSPEFFVLCLVNMLGLWLIYRKVDGNAHGDRSLS